MTLDLLVNYAGIASLSFFIGLVLGEILSDRTAEIRIRAKLKEERNQLNTLNASGLQ